MKSPIALLVAALVFSTFYSVGAQDSGTAKAERYIIESERQWAESVANGDTTVIERILAEDFVGIDPDGRLYDKAKMVSETRDAPKEFSSNHLNEVKVRFYGDAAVAQGSESWVRRTISPLRGRFVWTDTWIRRNGKWQIVAAEDLMAPEPSK
jgi:ketosteroid isomerase-like protein